MGLFGSLCERTSSNLKNKPKPDNSDAAASLKILSADSRSDDYSAEKRRSISNNRSAIHDLQFTIYEP